MPGGQKSPPMGQKEPHGRTEGWVRLGQGWTRSQEDQPLGCSEGWVRLGQRWTRSREDLTAAGLMAEEEKRRKMDSGKLKCAKNFVLMYELKRLPVLKFRSSFCAKFAQRRYAQSESIIIKTQSKTIVLQGYSFYLLVFFLSLLLFTVPRWKTIVLKHSRIFLLVLL